MTTYGCKKNPEIFLYHDQKPVVSNGLRKIFQKEERDNCWFEEDKHRLFYVHPLADQRVDFNRRSYS